MVCTIFQHKRGVFLCFVACAFSLKLFVEMLMKVAIEIGNRILRMGFLASKRTEELGQKAIVFNLF